MIPFGLRLCRSVGSVRDSVLNADGQFDLEGGPPGLIVPDPDISVVIGYNRIDNGQP